MRNPFKKKIIIEELEYVPKKVEGTIISTWEGNGFILDLTIADDIKVGMQFAVWEPRKVINDLTGAILGYPAVKIGQLEIKSIAANYSMARWYPVILKQPPGTRPYPVKWPKMPDFKIGQKVKFLSEKHPEFNNIPPKFDEKV